MIIIVGLGNPGKKFEKTRHNLGFQVIDQLHKKMEVYFFSDFELQKELISLISEGKFNNNKIILAKPQTFMNESGKSIKKLIRNYRLNKTIATLRASLWVVHDDIDLSLGKSRISIGRGSAGHKGVESIIKELGTKNFVRFRIGIYPKNGKPKKVERFVLEKFNKEEEEIIKEAIKKTAEAIEFSLKEELERAMNKFNK